MEAEGLERLSESIISWRDESGGGGEGGGSESVFNEVER